VPFTLEKKVEALRLEFKETETNLDVINLYSFFYAGCVQEVHREAASKDPELGRGFYLDLVESLSQTLQSMLR
jgi:hypothetical protein